MPYQPPAGFRQALRAGQVKFGLLALSGSAQVVEMSGYLGLDFVIIDMEHADGVGPAEVLHLVRAADAARMPALVRVARNEPDAIQSVLDHGAAGVCVPHIRGAGDAARAVAAARYPPEGSRSTCPYIRASGFGGRADVESFSVQSNRETVVMLLVEDRVGIDSLDEIAAVPGVDVLGVGLSDLARELGLAGDATHPELEGARRRTAELARRHGLATWTTLATSPALPEAERAAELAARLEEGFTMFSWQDASILREAILHLARPRQDQAAASGGHSNAFSPMR